MPKIRVQHQEIPVPENNPFKYDQLGRREAVETLTNIVSNVEGPCILSIDAPWGAGKTTFLRMWEKYLRKCGFVVVSFNAWENDFLDEPFVALSSEIIEELKKDDSTDSFASEVEALAGQAKQIIMQSLPTLAGSIAAGLPVFGPLGSVLARTAAERILSSQQKTQHHIREFNAQLKQLAENISDTNGGRPLIVAIDELDRCRPLYAIELLETAKHIFNVDNVIFALSTNRQQMAASIKAIYGDHFGGREYLERFFDIYFSLPDANRQEFITATLDSAGILLDDRHRIAKDAFVVLLDAYGLSLRKIAKAIHHLRVVLLSLGPEATMEASIAAMLMIYRTLDDVWYSDFIQGRPTSTQLRNNLSNAMPAENALVKSGPAFTFYETIMTATITQRRGEWNDAETLVDMVMTNKTDTPGDSGAAPQALRTYANAVLHGLHEVDMDTLIRKIELTSGDQEASQSVG